MKAILVFSDGRTQTIEILTTKMPRCIRIPSLHKGFAEFDRSGTSAEGLPIYGHLSAEIPAESSS